MNYPTPLVEAHFQKRYKRFFADVIIGKSDTPTVAHVPNTGSLKGICDEPRPCRLLKHDDPKRKLAYTLEQVKVGSTWVGVNTHRANDFVWEAFTQKNLPHWNEFVDGAREVKISSETRLDMRLHRASGKPHFVEVKSVTLAEGQTALFPDCETTRGQKHLRELIEIQRNGATAEMFFAVQRGDCREFSAAHKLDKQYAHLLLEAFNAGIRVSAYQIDLNFDKSALNFLTPLNVKF